MDASAAAFKGMTADLTQTAHTGVVDQDDVSSGTMRVKRDRPGDTRMLVDFTKPDAKTVQMQGQTLSIYYPKINTVTLYELGKNSSLIEQFLLLGFGTTSKDLESANTVTLAGPDKVGGQPAVRLLLTPRSKDVQQHIQKIELWLSPETGYPLQHKIYQAGGDYQIFAFQNLRMNPSDLSEASVTLKLRKDVKTERPQR